MSEVKELIMISEVSDFSLEKSISELGVKYKKLGFNNSYKIDLLDGDYSFAVVFNKGTNQSVLDDYINEITKLGKNVGVEVVSNIMTPQRGMPSLSVSARIKGVGGEEDSDVTLEKILAKLAVKPAAKQAEILTELVSHMANLVLISPGGKTKLAAMAREFKKNNKL